MQPGLIFASEWAAVLALLEGAGGVVAIAGILYRFVECQHPGCRRLGLHPLRHLRLCTLHHPATPDDGQMTAQHIADVAGRASPASHDPR